MLSTALSKILAAKALAAVVLLAGATGGVALAANASSGPSSTEETVTSTETADPEPADDENADSDENAAEADATKAPSPEPSIIGLCRAWAAGATDNPGKAAENPAFRSLVEAAGSEQDVPGFCAVRESVDQPGKSATAPGHADDEDAATKNTTEDSAGNKGGDKGGEKGGPPAAAPGNPDHLTGPPADRPTKNDDEADSKDAEESGSKGKGDQAKQGGQGGGAEQRPGD